MDILTTPAVFVALALVLFAGFLSIVLGALDLRRGLRPLVIALFALALPCLALFPSGGAAFGGMLALDGFTVVFAALFIALAIIVVLALEEPSPALLASVCLSTVGMVLASGARDILLLYLAIELSSAPLYALIAGRRTTANLEAATKYFIVSIVSSALLLLGVVLIAVPLGTTSVPGLIAAVASGVGPLALLGAAMFLAGLAFKIGIWPFNLWIPDVYTLAPAETAAFLAGASKKAAFAALLRVALLLSPLVADWTFAISVLAALTMTIPNLIALVQENPKRLVAYSIMTHSGYLLMGVATLSVAGYAAFTFHAIAHAFLAVGALLVIGVLAANKLNTVEELSGLGRRNPFLAASLTICLLGLAGMPLLSGFWSKLYLFTAAAQGGLLWLTALAIVNSAIALYYYFRIIRSIYGRENAGRTLLVRTPVLWAIGICVGLTLLMGLWPAPFVEAARWAVAALG